jgi:hypothetical protein
MVSTLAADATSEQDGAGPSLDGLGIDMAGKADFTEEEWEEIRRGTTGAGMMVAMADRGFFDTFKEAGSLAKFLAGSRAEDNQLVSELAHERPSGFGFGTSPDELETGTIDALRSAVATIQKKAPDDVDAYREFVLELAESVGKAAGGGEEAETSTIEKIRAALGS